MTTFNRAAYQRLNPNMSIHKTPKPKTPCLVFTCKDSGLPALKECSKATLRMIALNQSQAINTVDILLSLVRGETVNIPNYKITLVYR